MAGALLGLVVTGCSAIAGVFGTVGGETVTDTNDSCDRRNGAVPEPFCQEIVATLAGTPFQEDCVQKFNATPASGLCWRGPIVGGCLIDKVYQDGSRVTDWFYDISQLDAGAPDVYDLAWKRLTVVDVEAMCADRTRYEDGAHFVPAP